jgi:hypothetical protein
MAQKRSRHTDKPPQTNPYLVYRPYFVLSGFVFGLLLSGWYLYRVHLQATAGSGPVDTIPQRAFYTVLILFAATFQASLLSKMFAWLMLKLSSTERR